MGQIYMAAMEIFMTGELGTSRNTPQAILINKYRINYFFLGLCRKHLTLEFYFMLNLQVLNAVKTKRIANNNELEKEEKKAQRLFHYKMTVTVPSVRNWEGA